MHHAEHYVFFRSTVTQLVNSNFDEEIMSIFGIDVFNFTWTNSLEICIFLSIDSLC